MGGGVVVARPAAPPPVRVRRNAKNLQIDNPIMDFYAKAIRAMQAKLIADPTSWRFQAGIHQYNPASDPNASSTDVLPSAAVQAEFWNRCQHNTWFFLPWHRMYLHHFEQMILGHVRALGGPPDWALPYWDYGASPADAALPPAFRAASLADGSANPLRIADAERHPNANTGGSFTAPAETSAADALAETLFSATFPATSFGGGPTGFNHSGGNGRGKLESTPHGSMHVAVSGPGGFMRNFTKAPLDPIFWSHHCNIDRLWKVWLRQAGRTNPDATVTAWHTGTSFRFHDASGTPVTMTCSQVVNTRSASLDYIYEDEP